MTALIPDPVPLDPPPGDPRAFGELAGRLDRAGALLAGLGDRVRDDAGRVPGWTGRDADAATARVLRVGDLGGEAAAALAEAGRRLALHGELLADARGRLARLRAAQEEDFGAAAARLGGVQDVGTGADVSGALEELRSAEAARRRVAAAIREEAERDAAATAAVLAGCSAVTGGGGRWGTADAGRHLAAVLPGWHELLLAQRGAAFAAAVLGDEDPAAREAAARELLPWAGDPAVAAAVLVGLGAGGFRDVLRRLGEGRLSFRSALARVVAAALGAPVSPADARAVAQVRDRRLVDPGDHHTLDSDLVALGMGVVLAAGRGDPRSGPPPATVREWGRQIVARERALGGARIVDVVRPEPGEAPPGDPLQEVLARLAAVDDPAPAAGLLRSTPAWSHLLARPWDDDGAALVAVVGRAVEAPGATAVRAGLRALATGLGDDGDPGAWTVDPATAALLAPTLAEAVAARPAVLTGPLLAVPDCGGDDRTLLRGLGYLGTDRAAAGLLDRAVADAVAELAAAPREDGADPAGVVGAGYAAVREYGRRLTHALEGFAAQERAGQRAHGGDLLDAVGGRVVGPLAALAAVGLDLDGTWDEPPDRARHIPADRAVRSAGGSLAAGAAYAQVTRLLGTPEPPESPPVDVVGLATELLPGAPGRIGQVLDITVDLVGELLRDEAVREPR
ncbi:hypothetical protein JKP75_16500 [Blastococcus sp. TML/M2B]|uniref:hypothetical protein n=1 Tax=unclassified Blastococcus TaxID=2619396 RepID=UPI00190AF8ED|nr:MULTISPECIES: hypothetical protein [unclassified Blastococcus]MBN1094014.1 hypothetical protein [Blastococcus sp. TML/M2B]MBN1095868.1 hypothetical protein [Blastococcus sp. TML/C7B]